MSADVYNISEYFIPDLFPFQNASHALKNILEHSIFMRYRNTLPVFLTDFC